MAMATFLKYFAKQSRNDILELLEFDFYLETYVAMEFITYLEEEKRSGRNGNVLYLLNKHHKLLLNQGNMVLV